MYLVLDETGKLVGLAIDADLRADGSVRRPFLFIGSHSFVFQSGGAQ